MDFFEPYGPDFLYASLGEMLNQSYLGRRVFDVMRTIDFLLAYGASEVSLVGRGLGATTAAFAALTCSGSGSAALDASDISRGKPYTLEVSSRGVTQPLTEAKHFRRNAGRLVTVITTDTELTGRIRGVEADEVELTVGSTTQRVPLAQIAKATVQLELNRPVAGSDDDNEEA